MSGKKKALEVHEKFKEAVREKGHLLDEHISSYKGEITEIASQINGYVTDLVIFGGDGSILEAVRGLKRFDVRVSFIPVGTGNDLIKSLCGKKPLEEIFESILGEKDRYVDIGVVNDNLFLNVSGTGIDGHILVNQDKFKRYMKGPITYILSTFYTLMKYTAQSLTIETEDGVFRRKALLFSVANGKYFGGGMMVAPKASLEDELFDVIIINEMSKIKFTFVFPKVFNGSYIKTKEVEYFRAKSVKVESNSEIILNIDGNVEKCNSIDYKFSELKLRVGI